MRKQNRNKKTVAQKSKRKSDKYKHVLDIATEELASFEHKKKEIYPIQFVDEQIATFLRSEKLIQDLVSIEQYETAGRLKKERDEIFLKFQTVGYLTPRQISKLLFLLERHEREWGRKYDYFFDILISLGQKALYFFKDKVDESRGELVGFYHEGKFIICSEYDS
jgi:hypothetical protein